jgi:hypothetical protein
MLTCGITVPFCSRKPEIGKLRSSTVPRSAPRAITLANITIPERIAANFSRRRTEPTDRGVCHSLRQCHELRSPDPTRELVRTIETRQA